MGRVVQVKINTDAGGHNMETENGIFCTLMDLIDIDNNVVWDSVGAFFSLTGGYSVHKYKSGGGAVYDAYGDEIFITQPHIDALFARALTKRKHEKLSIFARRRIR